MRLKYRETSGEVKRVITYSIPATTRREFEEVELSSWILSEEIMENIRIPSETKIYFNREKLGQYRILLADIDVSPQQAIEEAIREARDRIFKVVERSCVRIHEIDIKINMEKTMLIYLPIWVFKYEVKTRGRAREYLGIVDATIGRVLYTTYPVGLRFRLTLLAAGLLHMVTGLGVSLLIGTPSAMVLGLGLSAIGTPLIIRSLMRGRGEEE